jgi:predicted TIM-barrel fold metal-dependent hydrolase
MNPVPRRSFLTGMAALGASALVPGCQTAGTPVAAGKPHRIDIHHHMVSPGYAAAMKERGIRHASWTVQRSLEEMDKSGIATSLTSLIQPAVWFGDIPLGRRLAREANEYAAKLSRDYPGRYASFATLPYPDTEGSLKEIEYSMDTLKAEGFCLMTSYGKKYHGDTSFWPLLEELNRRSAIVYTHPLVPECCGNLVPGVATGTIEYAVDTTRTMASLMFSGAAARFPNIRWIFSHSGGVAPFLVTRFAVEEKLMKDKAEKLPNGYMHELSKFYYDMAQGNHPGALYGLAKIAPVSQYLYGTDYPYRDGAEVNAGLAAWDFTPAERVAIDRGNALRMMPRLKG